MSIYEDRPEPVKKETAPKEDINFELRTHTESPYAQLSDILSVQLEFEDSVIYLNDEITEHTLVDLMIRIRRLLQFRETKDYKGQKNDPINLMINSPGGEIHEMMGIIDYLNSLNIKINTICRGKAFSAAAVILTLGSGTRMMSRNSTIMFHQASSMISGKLTDVTATVDFVKKVEQDIYTMLSEKTKKDAGWWKDHMRSDLYLTADKALEYGVIDQII
jgi:ATP-dependent Clp protease protease subunit|tara:strand:+ start:267 stop:923 length:657 start_codon:yes stop_codon:yes gene_type:complete